jgi:pimeloyl-ACP methyl ester carboxylesterase
MDIQVRGSDVHVYTGSRTFDRSQPSIVFVHGAALDHSVWALQSRYFAWHGANVLAVDLPGHGRSQGAPCPSVEAIADWIPALLDATGIASASLVGHSMGALSILECAARHPARVERISMLGPAVPMLVSDELLAAARDDEQLAYAMITAWSFSAGKAIGSNPSPGMSMTATALRLMQRTKQGTLENDLLACRNYADGLAAAAALACPAQLMLGMRDLMAPVRDTPPLIGALRDVRVVKLAETGHSLMAEQPDAVLEALKSFLPHRPA